MVRQKVKNTIPVYDIHTLADTRHMRGDITAERFANYLLRQKNLKFPHRHSFWHLVYFTKGGGTHTIDFETFDVIPGQIYFMAPGQVHSWHFEGKVDGYIVNFPGQLMHSFFREGLYMDQFPFFSGLASNCVVQLVKGRTEVERLLRQIVDEAAGNTLKSTEMICISLLSLFIRVTREMPVKEQKNIERHDQMLVYSFRQLVEQHYAQKHLPKEYATMLYITPNHLNAVCQSVLGKSAGEIIRDRILLEAKRLLAGHDIGVAEIAWQLNFSDNSYFTKFFKKYTGSTPEYFRVHAGLEQ